MRANPPYTPIVSEGKTTCKAFCTTLAIYVLFSLLLLACDPVIEEQSQAILEPICDIGEVTFSENITEIIETNCIACHNPNESNGNVNLEGYTNVMIYVNSGALLGTIDHLSGWQQMPPSGRKIPVCDIERITKWISEGAQNN